MKAKLFLFLLISLNAFSQNNWKSGYYISETGFRRDGLILDRDWNNNPVSFSFKENESAAETTYEIKDVKEFGIVGDSKYVRADVAIERSSNKATYMQTSKEPMFKDERLFLRVLVEGKHSLYVYNESGVEKFFYKTDDGPITQLIFINYITDSIELKENAAFRNFLWNNLKCEDATLQELEKLRYTKSALTKYFVEVNSCGNDNTITFKETEKKGKFNLKIIAGISSATLKFDYQPLYDFKVSGVMPAFGLELEYILPTNNSKWAAILEANYNKFSAETDVESGRTVDVKYNYLQVPFGMRHYLFLNPDNKLFFSGVMAVNFLQNSKLDYSNSLTDITPISPLFNFGLGLGYEYNRFSTEVRYYTRMAIDSQIDGSFNKLSAVVKYKIL